eukprot:scaffold3735_cov367-Prasinococcus_capsulatus_cf.AAC.4
MTIRWIKFPKRRNVGSMRFQSSEGTQCALCALKGKGPSSRGHPMFIDLKRRELPVGEDTVLVALLRRVSA